MLHRRLLCLAYVTVIFLMGLVAAGEVTAQQAHEPPDYAAWQRIADGVDEAISTAQDTSADLIDRRDQLVDWRKEFQAAQSTNANAIATVQEQLSALGPMPEDGWNPPISQHSAIPSTPACQSCKPL